MSIRLASILTMLVALTCCKVPQARDQGIHLTGWEVGIQNRLSGCWDR